MHSLLFFSLDNKGHLKENLWGRVQKKKRTNGVMHSAKFSLLISSFRFGAKGDFVIIICILFGCEAANHLSIICK